MPITPTYNSCPYTLKPMTQVDASREHIFPDAIGGSNAYTVRADRKANNDLGSAIDAPFVMSHGIAAQRVMHGIASRSGPARWVMRGETTETKRAVEVVFTPEGVVDVRLLKPLELAADGQSGAILVRPEEKDTVLKQIRENYARKGKRVIFIDERREKCEVVRVTISYDLTALKRAMGKIAYLATYEYLGDAFLTDPTIPEWRKMLFAPTGDEATTAQIYGGILDSTAILQATFPPLQPWEHAVAIGNYGQAGPVVAVAVFGLGIHNLIALASKTSTYGLNWGEGKIVICDARSATMRTMTFDDHFMNKVQGRYGQAGVAP